VTGGTRIPQAFKLAAVRADAAPGEVVRLRDGRSLGHAERGNPGGPVVLDFHGNPGSRLSFWGDDDVIRASGIRLISVDRPGIGLSDHQPHRSVADWPSDVVQLADVLGLERFAVIGHSVGAAYAAVCAHQLPERVTGAGLVSPIIPLDSRQALDELGKPGQWLLARNRPRTLRASIRALFLLARLAPNVARALLGANSTPEEKAISSRPEVMRRALASARESTRQGALGLVEDMRVVMRPWGFDPAEIHVPVLIWQGDRDSSIRESWGEWWAEKVPGAQLVRCKGEGHLLIEERMGEILDALATVESRVVPIP
jgi:pimeloyl-ACP methyl ester carboxylesterase